jgi:peptidoglycan/xylan/chitin deacetylase (PgdA/CDA1 family)
MSTLLLVMRSLGFFWLARRLTARRLRILCYHGISLRDEHKFNPGVFMRQETFARQMRLVKKLGLPLLGLDDAVSKLSSGALPGLATVITIDDGWYGTYRHMRPVLNELGIPATVYVATAFVEGDYQVFNVAVGYTLWRNKDKVISAEKLPEGALSQGYDLADSQQRRAAERELTRFGFGYPDFKDRQQLWRELCDAVGEDWRAIESERRLGFINTDELRQMMEDGLDIQLHTHGHRFPADDREDARREVVLNREFLNAVAPGDYSHFCYPSGQYQPEQIGDLRSLDVKSATTTQGGLNLPDTPIYELRRLIISDRMSDLEFEARISGVIELFEGLKSLLRRGA